MTARNDAVPADRGLQSRLSMASHEEFFAFHWPWLVRMLKVRANHVRMAEDAASEAMMAALDNWNDLLTYERPDSWLIKVAIRKLIRMEARARKECWLNETRASCDADLLVDAFRDEWVETHIELISAVRSLPRRQCEVIAVHFFGERTMAETARLLEMSLGTAKTHKLRALEALRQRLDAPVGYKLARRIPA